MLAAFSVAWWLSGYAFNLQPGGHWFDSQSVYCQLTMLGKLLTAGCQNVFRSGWQCSLPPRLCTWLPGFWSSAHVIPQCTSTTALFNYISAGSSTHCAFYHWRPHLSSDCCIVWNSLPKSVRSSSSLQVFCSRLKTELLARSYSYDWERLIALTTITWLHCLRLLLRVLVVLGLNATLQFNRPSFLSNCCMMQNI